MNILIVEDDTAIREGVAEFLKENEYEVFCAGDGEKALEILKSKEIHLALLDIMLPKKNGIEVLKELRTFSELPVIMLTAVTDDIKAWRDYNGLHFIQCACKFTDTCTTCNNEENRSKRVEIKELIKKLKEVNQYVEGNIFKSVENVNLETVVAYKKDGVKHHFLDDYDTKK